MFSSLIRRKRPRSEMTFLEHIDDLRVSLLRVFFTLFIGIGIALIYYEKLPHLLGYPLLWAKDPATSPIGILLGAADPTMQTLGELKEFTFMGVWSVMFYAAFAAGIALASPVLLYEIVRFVGPALTTREKRGLIPFCFSALILFIAGATLAFLWLTPMSIKVWHHFASGMGIAVTWQASDYFGFVIMMSLLTGLSFQFPLALIILMWLEIVRPITLLRKWRIMLFCIVLIVALITPIGDPISLLILSSILFSFYLIAVYIGSIIVRRKRIARGDTPYPDDDSDLYDLDDEDEEDEDLKVPPARPVKPKEGPPSPPGDIRSLD